MAHHRKVSGVCQVHGPTMLTRKSRICWRCHTTKINQKRWGHALTIQEGSLTTMETTLARLAVQVGQARDMIRKVQETAKMLGGHDVRC